MAGTVHHLVRESKDAALALATRAYLNRRLDGVVEVQSLTIDTAAQSAQLHLELLGEEHDPVYLDVKRYLLHTSDEGASVTIVDASASRPWIDKGLQSFVVGRPIDISTKAGFALRMLA